MKTLKLTIALICLLTFSANAQTTVNFKTKTVEREVPATTVRYYYLPEAESYYDVNGKTYIYRKDGKWKHWKKLPPGQAKKARWIKINNYNGATPYVDFEKHRVTYAQQKKVVVVKPNKKAVVVSPKKKVVVTPSRKVVFAKPAKKVVVTPKKATTHKVVDFNKKKVIVVK